MSKVRRVRLLMEASRAYGRELLRGICRYNALHGHWHIEQEAPACARCGASVLARQRVSHAGVDGVIMMDRKGSLQLLKKVPAVLVDCLHEDVLHIPRIGTDDPAIARAAAAHLLERGFRHFAFVGYDHKTWSRRRRDGFVQTVRAAGYECAFFVQARGRRERQWPQEQKLLVDWLLALPKPAGLLACNDDRARQVVDTCPAAGLNVPEEVAVVGVDNDELVCGLSNPPLSSVALDVEDAGYRAARVLDQLMTGVKPDSRKIVPTVLGVVARRSTESLAIEDAVVARAVRFIRVNCRKPIQVPEVLREMATSRRELYRRFEQALGCGVREYIKKARVAEIERLLLDADCTIAEIATLLGFPSADHIASYFRSVRGTNPLTLRSSRRNLP